MSGPNGVRPWWRPRRRHWRMIPARTNASPSNGQVDIRAGERAPPGSTASMAVTHGPRRQGHGFRRSLGADGAKTRLPGSTIGQLGQLFSGGDAFVHARSTVSPPTAALASDTSGGSAIANNGLVNVFGLELGGTWQYSLDGGQTWANGSGSTILPRPLAATAQERAGPANRCRRQRLVQFQPSRLHPGRFGGDAHPCAGAGRRRRQGDHEQRAGRSSVGLLPGATWQYSMNGGQTWTVGTGSSIALQAFGADRRQVRAGSADRCGGQCLGGRQPELCARDHGHGANSLPRTGDECRPGRHQQWSDRPVWAGGWRNLAVLAEWRADMDDRDRNFYLRAPPSVRMVRRPSR